jgi:pimeloyl-ACP methyl ester carboxylesterase
MAYALFKTPPLDALDELAVAGNLSYIDLHHPPLGEARLFEVIGDWLAPLVQATPAEAASAIDAALERAYTVAWALRGPLTQRASARSALGWIAVSGEDDMPHRPTNVPSPPFEQYEMAVPVAGRGSFAGVTVQTRLFIASPPAGSLPVAGPPSQRVPPPDPQPNVPDGNHVILFLHGHSSGAEEALAIIPHLHSAGLKQGKKFSIISFDLPNNGYSENFNHTRVAPSNASSWPAGLFDHGQVRVPVLDFIEDFIVAFVDALDPITPIKNRFAGVIGGSLGGNMGLRLGRRDPLPAWLDTGIVSWNAASLWQPMVQDLLKSQAPGKCQGLWDAAETPASRADYFHEVFETTVLPVIVPHTQPELWYRDGWEPCKKLHIKGSRIARREIYNPNFRQWHWRVAGEQLVYSHVDRVDHDDSGTPWRYELNKAKHLLVASKNDHFAGSNIFDATRTLASKMVNTPGRCLLLRDTGHSVHFERPAFFAGQIVGFLPATPSMPTMPTTPSSMQITCIYREQVLSVGKKKRTGPGKLGRILLVGGIDHTRNFAYSITVDECIACIEHGCDVFVMRTDGSRIAVGVVRKGRGRPYVATVHDDSESNNLLCLPRC